ncbi:ATP-dependent DNA ligase [beta proteobacterium AAP51]|nr:ATP-dependent DNA ligase [beta proteobacterium AAP51]
MRRFAQLYQALDASTATQDKVAALCSYLAAAPPADAAWAVYFLAGGKPRQVLPTALLRETACQHAGIDAWLFEECYQAVGDLAETIAHVLPPPTGHDDAGLATWVEERLLPLRGLPPDEQARRLVAAWQVLGTDERFLLGKLIGGGFRVGVSKLLVQRALAEHAGLDAKLMAQRLVGWTDARSTPSAERYTALLAPPGTEAAPSGQPYPFFLAHALQVPLAEFDGLLGPPADWLVEWKYDGIRAQVVKRAGQVWVWSRGEELITERFPEVVQQAAAWLEGTVVDGELLVWPAGREQPAPFSLLQQRITRKTLPKKLLAEAPVQLLAYDLLEAGGTDLRGRPQHLRRAQLEALADSLDSSLAGSAQGLRLSPLLDGSSWAELAALREGARERGMEGFMLKQRNAAYGSGRTKSEGTWWKWKLEPLAVDAVLVYAQAGHGRRASVYTDYTFAVWNRAPASAEEAQAVLDDIARKAPAPPRDSPALQLLPFAKAYSGLTDEEFKAVDRVIRATTLEKFGPVRSVKPSLVFEIGFEGLQRSPRHKSGVAVRFPRMLRIRHDKPLHEADTLATLLALNPGA